MITRDQFEKQYAASSGMAVESLRQFKVALPCNCEDPACVGWAAISLTDPQLLIDHLAIGLPSYADLVDKYGQPLPGGPK